MKQSDMTKIRIIGKSNLASNFTADNNRNDYLLQSKAIG